MVGRRRLLELGLSSEVIQGAIGAGRLRPIMRGVYAVGHLSLGHEAWCQAALLGAGEGAAISHLSAAMLWRLRLRGEFLPVDVITERNGGRARRQVQARRMRLHETEALVFDRLRVTTPARTIVDLAGILPLRDLRLVVERAQDLRRFSPSAIERVLARNPGRPGSKPLRDLLILLSPDRDGAKTHLERLVLSIIRRHRLPMPLVNHKILGKERDFVWPGVHLVLEADGYGYHSSRAARRRDNRRDRALLAAGWRTVRFTYEEVVFEPGCPRPRPPPLPLAPLVSSRCMRTRSHQSAGKAGR